jgi:hypothetical protein
MELTSYFFITTALAVFVISLGYGVRYGHMLFLVPGLNAKMVPRKIATSKYFGNRFLIVGSLGIPFSVLHILVQEATLEMAIMGLYAFIVVAFLLYIAATVNRLNEYNVQVMTRYRKVKREKERAKVKPRPVKRQAGGDDQQEAEG